MIILVVDDSADMSQMMGLILREEGHEVETMTSSLLARDRLLRPPRPDVLLVDLIMGGAGEPTGAELVWLAERTPELHAVRVIVLTGMPESGWPDLPPGTRVLVKPVKPQDLLDLLAIKE